MISNLENVKLMTVGDGAVGKTSLLMSYAQDTFPTDYTPTVFDNYNCTMVLNDKMNVSLGLWDTAGQDDYEQMRPLAYPGTHVFLVCFSLVNAVSLDNVRLKWVKEIKSFSEDVPLVLCGTKLDLYEDANYRKLMEDRGEQAVTEEQIKKVAEEIGASAYVLCSGKTQRNMSEVFKQCAIAGLIYQGVLKAPDKKPSPSKSNDGNKPQSGDGCCTIC